MEQYGHIPAKLFSASCSCFPSGSVINTARCYSVRWFDLEILFWICRSGGVIDPPSNIHVSQWRYRITVSPLIMHHAPPCCIMLSWQGQVCAVINASVSQVYKSKL